MPAQTRKSLIKELGKHRNSKMLTYVGSTRRNAEYMMQQMDIRQVYDHLEKIGKTQKIDLFIHSFGGDVTFPWRLVNLIREYSKEFHVIIPLHAFSAATLTSLGADSVCMLPAANLGPTDPQSTTPFNPKNPEDPKRLPLNTEDIAYYMQYVKDELKVTSESGVIDALKILTLSDNRIHPVALGHARRGTKLAEKYAEELLMSHTVNKLEASVVKKIVKTFGSELYAHDHPIGRKEAKKLGLNIVKESADIEKKIWQLFELYEAEMLMNEPFDPIAEFKKVQPNLPLSVGQSLNAEMHPIAPIKSVIIENENMTSSFIQEMDVTGIKFLDPNGRIREEFSWIIKKAYWDKT